MTIDCGDGSWSSLQVIGAEGIVRSFENCGDDWNDTSEPGEESSIRRYFSTKERVQRRLGFVAFRVGGRETVLRMHGLEAMGITFEVPRASLMTAVRYRIFDDLLIGNFMKTTFHGGVRSLYDPDFNTWVTKYADSGRAESEAEVADYLTEHRRRAGREYYRDAINRSVVRASRRYAGGLRGIPGIRPC